MLFSRYEDGARPVQEVPGGWVVDGVTYKTARGLLVALTGHPQGRHWSLNRYFRRGPVHGRQEPLGQANVFELFTAPVLGIDLNRRAGEVRKLLFAGFGRRMFSAGYDPEDVLQEVYKGILVRNAGRCPWDSRKSSFGHYVHMICACVLSNYHRKQHRVQEVEQLGMYNPLLEGRYDDVAACTTIPAKSSVEQESALLLEVAHDLADYIDIGDDAESRLASRILPLIIAGTPREDMTLTLGVSNASLSRAISHLRKQAIAWKNAS